tara:strand:+ start:502 stop:714 length:213 start_codon:yes stop_codon:yes gene_type:complete
MKKIRHSKLPITLESSDTLTPDMLNTIQLNMMYDRDDSKRKNLRGWEVWVDEYGNWFNPNFKNHKQMELF